SIFLASNLNPATPPHDGVFILKKKLLPAASVFLPLTKNPSVSREMGTRHRAAIGITEGTDAISIVASEETGLITFVSSGRVIRNVDTATLRKLLLEAMEIPIVSGKREQAKAMKESEPEITIG